MSPLAMSMFMTSVMLLRWTLSSVHLPLILKPKVLKEALQWRSEWVQSYVNQTEPKSELNLQLLRSC